MKPKGSSLCLQDPSPPPPPAPYPNTDESMHIFISCFFKIKFTLPVTPSSHNWSLPFRFSDLSFVFISPMRAMCHTRLSFLDLITLKRFSLWTLLQPPLTSSFSSRYLPQAHFIAKDEKQNFTTTHKAKL
jgi:hypothetical protein